jgi:hypothetical protein
MQKFVVYLFYKFGTHAWRNAAIIAVTVLLLLLFASTTWFDAAYYNFVDYDADRGATTVSEDVFGDSFSKVVYLDQGWEESDSLWFYNITQGSDLLPYDFFLALEQETSQDLFRSPENMNRYRYLPQKKTGSNPDALPVGMVADTYLGKKYMGFTCAACHSSQVNYHGVGIRIDGGPGAADMEGFLDALERSLAATLNDEAKQQRFVVAVLEAGNYGNAEEVKKDLTTYTLRMEAYNFFNQSKIDGQVDEQGNEILVKLLRRPPCRSYSFCCNGRSCSIRRRMRRRWMIRRSSTALFGKRYASTPSHRLCSGRLRASTRLPRERTMKPSSRRRRMYWF